MQVEIVTEYTDNGMTKFEDCKWVQVGVGNPKGVVLPEESGLWMLKTVNNPARDIAGLITPGPESDNIIVTGASGNQEMVSVPKTCNMNMAYWDYYSLPLRPGVILTP